MLQSEAPKIFGNPDPDGDGTPNQSWIDANIVRVIAPWPLVADWDTKQAIKSIAIHKVCAPTLDHILHDLWTGFFGQEVALVEEAGLHRFAGSFSYRPSRGSSKLSQHAYGAAIDFNAAVNAYGKTWHPGMMPKEVGAAFEQYGWTWGAFWSKPDAMHFQYARVG